MGLDTIETEMVEQFRQTLPPGEAEVDFYLALGYFRALGSSDCRAHALADYVSTSDEPPRPLDGGTILRGKLSHSGIFDSPHDFWCNPPVSLALEPSMKPSEQPPAWATSVLLVDGNPVERAFYAEGLKRCSPDYQILEVADGQSGLDLYRRSNGIECVVLELALPDMSGFRLLSDFILIPSRPTVAVVVLTHHGYKGLWELAKEHGAYACLLKQHTSSEDLDKSIQRAIAFVGQLPKEDRHRPTILP